jgi:hypothetical protein
MGQSTANISRNMHDEAKRYIQTVVQQGVPWVDADENDRSNALYAVSRRFLQKVLGDCFLGDAFKAVGSGLSNNFTITGGDNTVEGMLRAFVGGHPLSLKTNRNYTDALAAEVTPVWTAAPTYDSGSNKTTFTDSAAKFVTQGIVAGGRQLVADIAVGTARDITDVTETTLKVSGDRRSDATKNSHYRLNLSTPAGADRTDRVYLDVYLDEIDATEDANLYHTLGGSVEAQRRLMVVQQVLIREGGTTPASYTDSDGNLHFTIQLATIARFDGQAAINIGDITDNRPKLSSTLWAMLTGSGTGELNWAEVIAARGSLASLDQRLDVSLNEDGTLKTSASFGGAIDREEIDILRPHPQTTPNNTVRVEPGIYTKSGGTGLVKKAAAFNSSTFAPVATGGNVRYDVLSIDDSGNLVITSGTEVAAPGDPFTDSPALSTSRLALAIVKVDETGTVVIDAADIIDVREFLNKGGGSGGSGGGQGIPTLYELFAATAGQTVINLSGSYATGTHCLRVFRNGNLQNVGDDYTESSSSSITFTYPLTLGDEILVIQEGGGATTVVSARSDQDATAGQTVFNLSFAYTPGNNEIQVYSGGVLMREGDDYTESSGTSVTFLTGRAAGEAITVLRVGGLNAATPTLREKHVATAGQTVFNLTGSYPVGTGALQVFRNGKLLTPTDEYTESSSQQVTLANAAVLGDVLTFMVAGGDTLNTPGGVLEYNAQTATQGQTVVNLPFSYTLGVHALLVYRNGQLQKEGADFTESSTTAITFAVPLNAGEDVICMVIMKGVAPQSGIMNWGCYTAVGGETQVTTDFFYYMGGHGLLVFRNGQYMVAGDDYAETDNHTLTLAIPLAAGEKITYISVVTGVLQASSHTLDSHADALRLEEIAEGLDEIVISDHKPNNTAGGGASAATWNVRTLNSIDQDPNGRVSLASNQFTLPAGTYEFLITAPSFSVDDNKLRLYNVTDAIAALIGDNARATSTTPASGATAHVSGRLTFSTPKTFRVDHYTTTAQATNGLGRSTIAGVDEIYTVVRIRKVAGDPLAYLNPSADAAAQWREALSPIILKDIKATTVAGGTFTSGAWQTRALNTVERDAYNRCTLAANQFTLAAGTYKIKAYAPGYACGAHQARLRNITDGATTIPGASVYSESGAGPQTPALIEGVFTITAAKTFEIQHRCATTRATDGLGVANSFGESEVYSTVELEKIA